MAGFDAVFVGSGINSLAGAALLAKAGWKVCVLERNEWLGGAIRTVDGLIEPGFTHEVFASWHPLWTGSPAYAELKPDLDRLGVEYLNTELATGSAFPDGSSVFLSTDGAANAAELGDAWPRQFDEFMANADLAFGVLGTELWSAAGLGLGRQAYSRFGRRGLLEFGGRVLTTARDWLTETFDDEAAHGLLAPWVLHTGLGPDQATSGFMTQVIACALQLGGMPVPRGGGVKLVDGLATIVREAGGELRTESEVERIVVSDGRATAVMLAGGETIAASRAVLACVTPTQLYGRLLSEGDGTGERPRGGAPLPLRARRDADPSRTRRASSLARRRTACANADRARHARPGRRLARCQRGRARSTAGRGDDRLRPAARGRSVARAGGQGDPLDPAPGAAAREPKGDAADELETANGWDEQLREAYADRIVERLGGHIENLGASTIGRVVLGPAEIAAANPNWVGGDIYGGSCALDQNLLWRPTPATPGHETPVERLFHIGASTHPGPGLGAGSGYLAAKRLTRPPLPRRLLSKLPGL